MHKNMIAQSSLLRIRGDIGQLICEIVCIANAMLMEPSLPDAAPKLGSHGMRKAAFNTLGAPFDRLFLRGGKQDMNVLRHDHESMQEITSFFLVMEERAYEQFSVYSSSE